MGHAVAAVRERDNSGFEAIGSRFIPFADIKTSIVGGVWKSLDDVC